MTSNAVVETQVLIAGMGPVGDVLAALLAQYGVTVLAIDREADIYQLPRAAVFDDEIMRVFQQLDIVDAVLPHTRVNTEYEFVNGAGQTLMHFHFGALKSSGWAPGYLMHQPGIEATVRDRLKTYGNVDLRLSHRLVSIDRNDADGVTAVIADGQGTRTEIHARFLVGADGGASTVRKLLGIKLFDYGFEEPWMVVDALMQDESGLSAHAMQYCDPERPTTVVPMSPGRRRWEFMLKPGEDFNAMLDDAVIERLLTNWVRPGQAQLVRKAVYQFHGLVAQHWRVNSVLLAGDAAHQMPPFLGQGMCSGIRDAVNLAWKLAAVLHGHATARLLDSYQSEREPHVRFIIETAIGMGRVICTLDPGVAAQRDAEMLAARAAHQPVADINLPALRHGCLIASPRAGELFPQPMARLCSGRQGRLDDLLGEGFWLITRDAMSLPCIPGLNVFHLGSELNDAGDIEQWLNAAQAQAVLVRPDRQVFGTGDPRELCRQLSVCLGLTRG